MLEKLSQDSEARVEKMIEKHHNELKESIDDIKSEVKRVKDDVDKTFDDLKAEINDRDRQLLEEIALQDERKAEIIMFKIEESHGDNQEVSRKYDMSEIQKTQKEVCQIEGTDIVFCKRIGIRNLPVKPGIQSTKLIQLETNPHMEQHPFRNPSRQCRTIFKRYLTWIVNSKEKPKQQTAPETETKKTKNQTKPTKPTKPNQTKPNQTKPNQKPKTKNQKLNQTKK
jgi:hypothetical protein